MRTAGLTALLLLAMGCGPDVIAEGAPVDDPYDGPLYIRVSQPDHLDPVVRSGAAGMTLECSGDPFLGSTGRNWGVTSGHGTSVDALESFLDDEDASLPPQGYRVERETQDRVLFSYDVEGDTKVAIIVADGLTDATGESAWSVETFAQCDPAEFPAAVTDELGIQVWVNQQGKRVPTTVIQSSQGPEHCDWDSTTFLHLKGDTFIRDPKGVLPRDWFSVTFDDDVTLPEDVDDTGYRLDRQRLWVAADRSAAYIATENAVERWPAATGYVGCA